MSDRPVLDKKLDGKTFRQYYYLKEELVTFCKEHQLPASGNKKDLTERIAAYLDSCEVVAVAVKKTLRKHPRVSEITLDTPIEPNFVCTQQHRAFFEQQIGRSFSFSVVFQKWLRENAGKRYQDAIDAYHELKKTKRFKMTIVEPQFEYNTYIRDFFADNKGKTLNDAIACWNYKKTQAGSHRYEKEDLKTLKKIS